ncbi:MAG: hypothetical protein ACFFGZ_10260 [Candidatus Thorarchaeota archaeon]
MREDMAYSFLVEAERGLSQGIEIQKKGWYDLAVQILQLAGEKAIKAFAILTGAPERNIQTHVTEKVLDEVPKKHRCKHWNELKALAPRLDRWIHEDWTNPCITHVEVGYAGSLFPRRPLHEVIEDSHVAELQDVVSRINRLVSENTTLFRKRYEKDRLSNSGRT